MKYFIEDVAEENANYIKEGKVSRSDFIKLLINELDAYVDAEDESFTVEVNGVAFTVEK